MSESTIQPQPAPEQAPAPPTSPPTAPAEVDVRKPDGALARMVPYRNPLALISYYCALFSILPVFAAAAAAAAGATAAVVAAAVLALILAPLAVLFGIIGLRRARRNPQARGTGHAWFGIVLGGLMTLLNWGTVGYCSWAINYDDTFQRIYHEARRELFGEPPAPREEDEPE
jgi:Domain of unknown function (DUF4190)